MRLHRVILWLLALVVGTGVVAAQGAQLPRLETGSCEFDPGYGRSYGLTYNDESGITCGYLIAPEDRDQPDGNRVRLHYAIYHALADEHKPDPVVFLDGGPGSDTLMQMPWAYYAIGAPLNADRDVIFFDQRGTGYSRPALDCPEYDAMRYDLLGEEISSEESRALIVDTLRSCHDRLESRGVNVANYNSAENAADLDDLRELLGYDQWNLYGISYGTRLALTAMRDQPDGIRSVIIDSVLPLEASLYDDEPANLERALNTLFLGCTLDEECNAHYPRLGTVFYDTVARLNAEPGIVRITHPTTRAEYSVLVDGNQLIGLAFGALYSREWFQLLPEIIYDVRDGNYRLLGSTLQSILEDQEGFSMGMHFAVQCNEETPFVAPENVAASLEASPILGGYFANEPNTGNMIVSVCHSWTTVMPASEENAPVVSDIPTLVISGEYDPITPPSWGKMVADSLPNSFYYEIPGAGHGASVGDPCPESLLNAFLNDPTSEPDSSCIADMPTPDFLIVEDALDLEPFHEDDLGISSLRPASWLDVGGGKFVRNAVDATLIAFFHFTDMSSDDFLRYLAAEFDVYDHPTPREQRTTSSFTWQIFEFRRGDDYVHAALAENGRESYWVMMVSTEFERDLLYEGVLIPAVDAFVAD
ncbi:MAG: alpha/beta fold hydrolase [Anaerolineae bacterium]|nr:alpha/beta fold hydrolase [Anaerolineae bacterium]